MSALNTDLIKLPPHDVICDITVLSAILQLLPRGVPFGGRAAAREGGQERKPAAAAWEEWELLRHHHQTRP